MRSAKSFTTFTEWQVSWFRLYCSRLSHSLGSCSRSNAHQALRFLKTGLMKFTVTKLCKLWGSLEGYIRLRGSSDQTFCRSRATTSLFSCDTFSSRNAEAIKCSDKYHIWRSKAVVAALASSLSGYKNNSWRRSRSFLGTPVPDGHWNQYLT